MINSYPFSGLLDTSLDMTKKQRTTHNLSRALKGHALMSSRFPMTAKSFSPHSLASAMEEATNVVKLMSTMLGP